MVVVERMVLDADAAIRWHKHAEPHAGGPVIRWHSDDTGVVPQAAAALTSEGQTAMPGDDAVATGSRQFLRDRLVAGGEDETIDAGDAAMHHNNPATADLKVEPAWQGAHPEAALRVDISVGIGILLPGENRAGTVLGKAAAALRGLSGASDSSQLPITIRMPE